MVDQVRRDQRDEVLSPSELAEPKVPQPSKSHRTPWAAIVILSLLLVVTIFAPLLAPYSPNEISLVDRLQPPMWSDGGDSAHILGTDVLGRDLLTRIFYGGRVSMLVGVVVLGVAGSVGLILGIVGGYTRGLVGTMILRLIDSLLAIPLLLLAIVFAVTFQPGFWTVVVALSAILWARFARVIQGDAREIAGMEYVKQAQIAGVSTARIMRVHLLPNVASTFLVLLTLNLAWVILVEAALSFLGAGIPPPTPSWGRMVASGRDYLTSAWWISLFPGLTLAIMVLCINLIGDWLRDRLDPRLSQI